MNTRTREDRGAIADQRSPHHGETSLRRSLTRGALAAVLLVCVATAQAHARSIEIDDFAVDLAVDESGGFDVTETLRLRFSGSWNGIIRSIPIQNVTSRGEWRNLGFRFVSVTDDAGRPLETQRSRRGADVDLKIRVPGAADAERTVVIRYRITGGLRFFDDHDELYWNLTGDEWTFPIHAARARITLPASLVNVRVNAFTGHHGSRERAVKIRVNGGAQGPDDAFVPAGESPPPPGGRHEIEIEATRRLDIREGLTAAVAWNPGVVRRPSAWARFIGAWSSWFVGRPAPQVLVGLPLLAFLGMLGRWWFAGRDPRPGPLVVEYGPPDGLGPAEAGTLVDNRPDNRDLIAGIVDAAVKGVLRIREMSPKGWFRRPAYAFDLLVPAAAWAAAGISPAGCRMLRSMFTSPDGLMLSHGVLQTVTSSELDCTFHVHLKSIKDAIFADLVGQGLYRRRPDRTATGYLIFACVCGALAWGLGALAVARAPQQDDVLSVIGPMLAGVATLVVVGLFAVVMPARTPAGARVRDRVRGFREFLGRVESQRLESLILTPELFEKCLPYAIALGVERRWARAFAGICTAPPAWYVGTSLGDGVGFDVGGFTDRLDVMGDATAAVMTSAPRSTGDSGFGGSDWGGGGSYSGGGGGGGGFSGGGDGGGGGSGW